MIKVFILSVSLILAGSLVKNSSGTSISGPNPPSHATKPSELNGISISHQLRNTDSDFKGSDAFDEAMQQFLHQYGIKGASVAIALNDRLIYAKGYGYADYDNDIPMEPFHILRIASVSKLLTASAIMKLVEQGKLSLDSKVFGKNGLLNDSIYLHFRDKRYERITVRQLLTHTAGWGKRNGDPVFFHFSVARKLHVPLPVTIPETIEYALGFSLPYAPGTHYCYSNLGYVILGEIISKLSKQPYEQFVQNDLLAPAGIYDMHIGNSFLDDKFWNESKYYQLNYTNYCDAYDGSGRQVPQIYGGNNINLLGAAGGWLASPSELLKFVLSIGGDTSVQQLISRQSFDEMTTPDPETHHLLGWGGRDDDGSLWRTGSLVGTNALVEKRSSGLTWVVILNSSGSRQKSIPYAILRTIQHGLDAVDRWPDYDLFTFKKMDLAKPIATGPVN